MCHVSCWFKIHIDSSRHLQCCCCCCSIVCACTVKLTVASDSTTKGNVQSQNAFVVCVCSVRGDGLPSGHGKLRQENTWLRKATISYRAVTGYAYLLGMFLLHTNHDESIFVIHSLVCLIMGKKNLFASMKELNNLVCH